METSQPSSPFRSAAFYAMSAQERRSQLADDVLRGLDAGVIQVADHVLRGLDIIFPCRRDIEEARPEERLGDILHRAYDANEPACWASPAGALFYCAIFRGRNITVDEISGHKEILVEYEKNGKKRHRTEHERAFAHRFFGDTVLRQRLVRFEGECLALYRGTTQYLAEYFMRGELGAMEAAFDMNDEYVIHKTLPGSRTQLRRLRMFEIMNNVRDEGNFTIAPTSSDWNNRPTAIPFRWTLNA